jgi:hypothetical protein
MHIEFRQEGHNNVLGSTELPKELVYGLQKGDVLTVDLPGGEPTPVTQSLRLMSKHFKVDKEVLKTNEGGEAPFLDILGTFFVEGL